MLPGSYAHPSIVNLFTARCTSLAPDSVDFVIANHVIEHLEDPIRGLVEITRVIRPGGILFLAVPDQRATFDRHRPVTPVDHLFRGEPLL